MMRDARIPDVRWCLPPASASACGRSPTRCRSRWSRSPASTLLDCGLDSLAEAGVDKAVVNVHYLPEQIVAHVAGRTRAEDRHLRRARRAARFRPAASSRRCLNSAPSRSTSSMPTPSGSTRGHAQSRAPRPCLGRGAHGYSADARRPRSGDRPYRRHRLSRWPPDGALRRAERRSGRAGLCRRAIVHPRLFAGAPDGPLRSTAISTRPSPPAGCSACRCTGTGSPSARPTPSPRPRRRSTRHWPERHERPRTPASSPFRPARPSCRRWPRRCSTGRLIPGFPLRRRSAGARRRHHLRADAPRGARAARPSSSTLLGGGSAILPVIRPLGEFDEDEAAFEAERRRRARPCPAGLGAPIACCCWRRWCGPGSAGCRPHVAAMFDEQIVVPASAADAIWLARDLAGLMDEIETEGSDWARLAGLVPGESVGLVAGHARFPLASSPSAWPEMLEERGQSNPAAHRSALIRLEAERLTRNPPAGPVIAAGSTGSIPATAELLAAIARLPRGAVVLPGLDRDARRRAPTRRSPHPVRKPAVLGHPQYGLAKLIGKIGILRGDIEELGASGAGAGAARGDGRRGAAAGRDHRRLGGKAQPGRRCRDRRCPRRRHPARGGATSATRRRRSPLRYARRSRRSRAVAPLSSPATATWPGVSPPNSGASASRPTIPAACRSPTPRPQPFCGPCSRPPSGPAIRSPCCRCSSIRCCGSAWSAPAVRRAAETIELVVLRGGVGRPDVAQLADDFEARLSGIGDKSRKPFWFDRVTVRPHRGGARCRGPTGRGAGAAARPPRRGERRTGRHGPRAPSRRWRISAATNMAGSARSMTARPAPSSPRCCAR